MRNRSSFKNGGAGYKNRYKLFSLLLAFILVTVFMPKTEVMAASNTLGNSGVTPAKGDYKDFSYTGGVQSFTVPVRGIYKLEVWGGQGGGTIGSSDYFSDVNDGGKGGYSYVELELTRGTVLYVACGGSGIGKVGWNGGGTGQVGANGGGASHIALVSGTLSSIGLSSAKSKVLCVAGGGGGGTNWRYADGNWRDWLQWSYSMLYGGYGGGTSGGDSWMVGYGIGADDYESYKIYGATQTSGYAFGQGENGTAGHSEVSGAGGGGWYGGYGNKSDAGYNGGGSGGSGWVRTTGVESYGTQGNKNSGNGKAKITLTQPIYYITYDKNVTNATTTASPTVSNMPTPNPEYYTGSESVGTFTVSDTVPTRDGYTFNGWNTKSDGTGTKHSGGDTIILKQN